MFNIGQIPAKWARLTPDRPAIIDFLSGNTAIRTEQWRYIHYDEGQAGEELYNLRDDPEEWHNLIGKFPEKVNQLRAWLPHGYADAVPTKKAYHFHKETYSWTTRNQKTKENHSK